jgi:DNA polymerase III alpha subunit
MNTNEYGQVTFDTNEVLSMLYNEQQINECMLSDKKESSKHLSHAGDFAIENLHFNDIPNKSAEDYHADKSSQWNMPDQYKNLDVESLLSNIMVEKGLTDTQYVQRMADEMQEYRSRNMIHTLRFLKYLMDTCEQHDIITGIGRGSSVSSLVLHLLDVHHIDPIKYNLDYKEFLR